MSGNILDQPVGPEPCPFPDCPEILFGGGCGIRNTGTLTLIGSTVSDNHLRPMENPEAGNGGGILGDVTLINSTVSGNTAFIGGGIAGTAALISSTVAFNQADSISGGTTGPATARNSIVAGNSTPQGGPGGCTELDSQGFNLIGTSNRCRLSGAGTGDIVGVNPRLGPLQNNGGQTPTHALLAGSPAIDAGNPAPPVTAFACR